MSYLRVVLPFGALLLSAGTLLAQSNSGETTPNVAFRFDPSWVEVPPEQVSVAGSFNDWSTTALPLERNGTAFAASATIADGDYAYLFRIVDEEGNEYWLGDRAQAAFATGGPMGVGSLLRMRGGMPTSDHTGLEAFEFRPPNAATWVNLAGDFCGWKQGLIDMQRDAEGVWRCWLLAERPMTYRFVVDDMWYADPSPGNLHVPSNYDGYNSFRPRLADGDVDWMGMGEGESSRAAGVSAIDDGSDLDVARRASERGDYQAAYSAVAAARRAAEANRASTGARSTARSGRPDPAASHRAALAFEADLHRKFGKPDRAVVAFERLAAAYPDSAEGRRARHEVAKHYLYETEDYGYARALFSDLIDSAKDDREVVSALFDLSMTYWKEGRLEEQIAVLDRAMAMADPPDPADDSWTHLLMEALVYKGVAEARLGMRDRARASLERVVAISPWPNPHNVQTARKWLARLDREDADAAAAATSASAQPESTTVESEVRR